MTRRWATAVAVALLVFVIAIPSVGACCVANPGSGIAAMHAAMPCCANHCTMADANSARGQDQTAVSTPLPDTAVVVVVSIADLSSPANASAGCALDGQSSTEFSPPAPFLLHSQFRI
jgi:hypothetical protein